MASSGGWGGGRYPTPPPSPLNTVGKPCPPWGELTAPPPPHAPPAGPRKPRVLLIFPVVISRLREGLSVRALLRCDFPLRFEASGCSCARLPAGLRLGAGPFASPS